MYVSPYGRPRGLVKRLLVMAGTMATDRGRWAGTGIIEDLKLTAKILNRREWLEKMRLSSDPEAQEFAAELLAADDEFESAEDAARHVTGLPDEKFDLGPTVTIERLDAVAVDYGKIRDMLVDLGALADDDTETPVVDLLRALLS